LLFSFASRRLAGAWSKGRGRAVLWRALLLPLSIAASPWVSSHTWCFGYPWPSRWLSCLKFRCHVCYSITGKPFRSGRSDSGPLRGLSSPPALRLAGRKNRPFYMAGSAFLVRIDLRFFSPGNVGYTMILCYNPACPSPDFLQINLWVMLAGLTADSNAPAAPQIVLAAQFVTCSMGCRGHVLKRCFLAVSGAMALRTQRSWPPPPASVDGPAGARAGCRFLSCQAKSGGPENQLPKIAGAPTS